MTQTAKFTTVLIIVGLAAFALSATMSLAGHEPKLTASARSTIPESDQATERRWLPYDKTRLLTIESGPGYFVYFPADVRVGHDDHIFIRDDGDLSVKEFSPEGELVQVYGGKEGEGPGEFTSLTDFIVDDRNRVWMVDATNGRITIYSANGTIESLLPLRHPPYRLAGVEEDRFTVMREPIHASKLFATYELANKETSVVQEFGVLLDDQERDSLALDGWIYGDNRGFFVFAPIFAGYLGSFDLSGHSRFLVETVDPIGLPRMQFHDDGTRMVRPDSARSAFSVSVDGNKIYLLTMWKSGIENLGASTSIRLTMESTSILSECRKAQSES